MDRRQFIKVTAITGTTAALARCGNPENQIVRFIPDEEIVPGIAVWKPSVCPLCAARCGALVRVLDGDVEVTRNGQHGVVRMALAKKLEGNPADPINKGKLCARGQAAIQLTYHPDRVGQPLSRSGPRGSGQFTAISWDEALATLIAKLDELAATNQQAALACVVRPHSGLRNDLLARFLQGFGAPAPIAFELFGDDVLRRANLLSFGREQLPTPDLAASRYVVSFGADFLGTWNAPVAQTIGFANMRQGRAGMRGKFVQLESRMSQTGASADEWVAVRPGTEGVAALGIAHVLMGVSGKREAGRAGSLIDGWSSGLPDFTPALVEQRAGIPAARLERLAREFANHGPAVAIAGGTPLAHTNGLFTALAVNALNTLVGSIDSPGGVTFTPQLPRARVSYRPLSSLISPERPVQVLLVDQANPVFATPAALELKQAIESVPFIASFSSFVDETSALADLILPDHSFLESWMDAAPESGSTTAVARFTPPAMRPLHETRATADIVLDISRRLKSPLDPPLPWQNTEEMLRDAFGQMTGAPATEALTPNAAAPPEGSATWEETIGRGSWSGSAPVASRPAAPAAQRSAVKFSEPQLDGETATYPFHFLPFASQALVDGSLAHLPWLQEMPDPLSTAMWSAWVEINPQTAARLEIATGDVLEVASAHGSLHAPAVISPGIAPDVVAMPVGQGHGSFTRYASGRGANPIAILAPVVEPETGALAWAATRVRVRRAAGPNGELILFAGATRERPYEEGGR